MSVLNRGSVFRAVGRSGRCVAAARVLATATAAQQQTASSATVAAAAASRHTSSLPPPLPLGMSSTPLQSPPSPSSLVPPALSKTPEDYHYPFGNPTLLISTLPSLQHASSGSVASPPDADALSKKPPPEPTEDDAALSSLAVHAATSPLHSTAAPAEGKPVRLQRTTPRSPKKRTPKRAPGRRPEATSADGAKAVASVARPAEHLENPQQQHRSGWDGAAVLEAAVVESDPDASVAAAVELPPQSLSDPIHVLGSNPRATYLAHILAGIPHSPPVRLVLLGRARQNRWNAEGRGVRVLRGRSLLPRRNVEAEPAREAPAVHTSGGRERFAPQAPAPAGLPPIQNLVVTLGCAGSIDAIQKLQHRIDHRTTICLIQCGLGVAERLNALFFPDPAKRPRYVLGHMTHSLGYHDRSFTVSELKPGKLFLTAHTAQPTPATTAQTTDGTAADDGRRLVHLLSVAPLLGAGGYAEGDFLRWALPSILYAAAVEPVATVLDLPVDALWHNGEARALVEALLTEMVAVVRQLPETRASPALAAFVQSGALRRQVLRRRQQPQKHEADALGSGGDGQDAGGRGDEESHAWDDPSASFASAPRDSSSASSSSSTTLCTMAQRVRAGRVTDIEFLNGYFVRRGRECGVACPMNEMAIRLVRSKQLTNRTRLRAYVPLVDDSKDSRRGRGHGSRSASEADFRMAEDAEAFPSAVLPQQQPAPEAAQPPRRVPAWWRLPVQSP